jgi:hypothetical protein
MLYGFLCAMPVLLDSCLYLSPLYVHIIYPVYVHCNLRVLNMYYRHGLLQSLQLHAFTVFLVFIWAATWIFIPYILQHCCVLPADACCAGPVPCAGACAAWMAGIPLLGLVLYYVVPGWEFCRTILCTPIVMRHLPGMDYYVRSTFLYLSLYTMCSSVLSVLGSLSRVCLLACVLP